MRRCGHYSPTRIARNLGALNGPLLKLHKCLFGGGAAIVFRFGEYRESVDIDFLVSDVACHRDLRRGLLSNANGQSGQ